MSLDRTSIHSTGLPYTRQDFPLLCRTSIVSAGLPYTLQDFHWLDRTSILSTGLPYTRQPANVLEGGGGDNPYCSPAESIEVLSRIWRSFQEYGSPAEDMEVLPRMWKSCRGYGSPVESMEVLSRAWKSCKHGSPVEKSIYRQKKQFAAQRFYYLGTPNRYFDELNLEVIVFDEKSFFSLTSRTNQAGIISILKSVFLTYFWRILGTRFLNSPMYII